MNRLYTHPDMEVKRKAVALLPGIPTARAEAHIPGKSQGLTVAGRDKP